jgi:hypothetical protein
MNMSPVVAPVVASAAAHSSHAHVSSPAPVIHDPDEFEFDFAMCHGSYYYCRYYQG